MFETAITNGSSLAQSSGREHAQGSQGEAEACNRVQRCPSMVLHGFTFYRSFPHYDVESHANTKIRNLVESLFKFCEESLRVQLERKQQEVEVVELITRVVNSFGKNSEKIMFA